MFVIVVEGVLGYRWLYIVKGCSGKITPPNEQTLVYLIEAVLALILAIFNSYSEQVRPFLGFLLFWLILSN